MNAVVRLIARPTIDWEAIDQFLKAESLTWRRSPQTTETEHLVEFSGRVCYMSFGDKQSSRTNRQYISNLIDQGHESVLEHAFWTFEFSRVSRSFSHQLVRHRIGFSFSQLSQQYVDHEAFEMLAPLDLSRWPTVSAAWSKAEQSIRDAYRELRDEVARSFPATAFSNEKERQRFIHNVARQILPNAVSTTIVVTANARAIRHFLALRGANEGDAEMRDVAVKLFKTVSREAPRLFEDFEVRTMIDGSPAVVQLT